MANKGGIPTFHESAAEIDRMQRRRAIRQRLQNEFNRQVYNPQRLAQHIEILDPSVARYTAMRATIFEHWKPSWQSFWKYAFCFWIPVSVLALRLNVKMIEYDEECRTGKIPYKDRDIGRV